MLNNKKTLFGAGKILIAVALMTKFDFYWSPKNGTTWCIYPKYWVPKSTTVLSTSHGKTFFAWRFIINDNILFWLTMSYQKLLVFSVSVFCSQTFTLKLNLRSKIGLTYAISIVKWFFFGLFVLRKYFLLLFIGIELLLLMLHNNIVKNSEKLN